MARQRIVRLDCLLDHVRTRGVNALIDVIAIVAPWPAIKAAISNRCHIVRHKVGAELVALVHNCPEFAGLRMECQPVRIAQAGGVDACGTRLSINLPDCGPAFFCLKPAFRNVRIRTDGNIEHAAVRTERHILRPVMVQRTSGKWRKGRRRLADLVLAEFVRIGENGAGRRYIERVVGPSESKGRIEAGQKIMTFIYLSIAIGIAQQSDEVSFLLLAATGGSHRHDPAADEVLRTTERLSLRRLRLHNQHIAIRQRVNRAWVGEVFGIGCHLEAFRYRWRFAILPADYLGHFEVRQQFLLRFRQDRVGSDLLGRIECRSLRHCGACEAGRQSKGGHARKERFHLRPSRPVLRIFLPT
ncbi:hypothetical protein D3C71_984340 [compost metagenome]